MGIRHRKRCPSNSHQDAHKYELYLRRELAEHGGLDHLYFKKPARQVLFREFADRWFREYVRVNNRPCVQRGTWSVLQKNIIPVLGDRELRTIGVADIDKLKMALLDRGLSAKTVNNNLGVLRRCLGSAREWNLIEEVPRVQFLKARPPAMRFLEPADARRLVAAAPPGYWKALVVTALHTGLRVSELIGLEWRDVDFGRGVILVQRGVVGRHVAPPKSNRCRHVAMSEEVHAALAALPRTSERVFPVPSDVRHPYDFLRTGLRRIAARADLQSGVGWHMLRHSFASHLVCAGAPLRVVQEALGHSSYEMTLRYAHLDVSALRETMKLLPRFDRETSRASATPADDRAATGDTT